MAYYPNPLIALIDLLLSFYWWVVIAAVVASWLVMGGVINVYNNLARSVLRALEALTEPVFRRIRAILPPMGGLDLSPMVVLFGIWFLQYFINWAAYRYGL